MTPLVDPAAVSGLSDAWAEMIAPVVIKGSLLLGLFGLLNQILRRASASTRHLLWTLSLVAVLCLPVVGAGLPAWRVLDIQWFSPAPDGGQEMIAAAGPVLPAAGGTPALNSATPPSTSPGPKGGGAGEPAAPRQRALLYALELLTLKTWLFFIWQAGVLILLGTILLAAFRLWSLERSATVLRGNGST